MKIGPEEKLELLTLCGVTQQHIDEFDPANERERLLLVALNQMTIAMMIMLEAK